MMYANRTINFQHERISNFRVAVTLYGPHEEYRMINRMTLCKIFMHLCELLMRSV